MAKLSELVDGPAAAENIRDRAQLRGCGRIELAAQKLPHQHSKYYGLQPWANKISQDPKITVSLKSDDKSRMQLITEVHTQLRNAQALKLNYSTLTKPSNL